MPALIFDYYPHGNIVEFVKNEAVKDEEKMDLIVQVARGIQYLHTLAKPVVHGDIRGANILITDSGRAVLIDYSLAFIIESSDFTSIKTAGTCRWTAPEIMDPPEEPESGESPPLFTTASDVFAYAMTIIEVFTEKVPFANKKNDSAVIFAILGDRRPDIPEYIHANYNNVATLISQCWQKDPGKRPTARTICEKIDVKKQPTSFFGALFRTIAKYIPFPW